MRLAAAHRLPVSPLLRRIGLKRHGIERAVDPTAAIEEGPRLYCGDSHRGGSRKSIRVLELIVPTDLLGQNQATVREAMYT